MIYFRYTSLEGSVINVIPMTYGCLTYTRVYGLNLIYMVNSHKGGFLIPPLLQTLTLSYMAGRFPINLALSNSLTTMAMHIPFFFNRQMLVRYYVSFWSFILIACLCLVAAVVKTSVR
jgi:hypothetical protein